MRRILAVLALVALTGSATSSAGAQDRRGRDDRDDRDRGLVEREPAGVRGGFFITGGLGAGSEQFKFDDEEDYSERLTKPTGMLRLGGTPNSSVRIGGELFGWGSDVVGTPEQPSGMEVFGTALLTGQFYPIRNGGLYFKVGGGLGVSGLDYDDPGFLDVSENGFAWSVGAGFDIQLSRSVSIAPSVDLYQASFTSRDEPTLTERVLNIGVQLTFQSSGGRR